MPEPVETMAWEEALNEVIENARAAQWEERDWACSLATRNIQLEETRALARRERERAEGAEAFAQSCSDDLAFLDKVRAANQALKAQADRLAEAVGKLPITGGPVYDALMAYREGA